MGTIILWLWRLLATNLQSCFDLRVLLYIYIFFWNRHLRNRKRSVLSSGVIIIYTRCPYQSTDAVCVYRLALIIFSINSSMYLHGVAALAWFRSYIILYTCMYIYKTFDEFLFILWRLSLSVKMFSYRVYNIICVYCIGKAAILYKVLKRTSISQNFWIWRSNIMPLNLPLAAQGACTTTELVLMLRIPHIIMCNRYTYTFFTRRYYYSLYKINFTNRLRF